MKIKCIYPEEQTEEQQLKLISADYTKFKLIETPSFRVQRLAVRKSPSNIQYIKKPSVAIQLIAVSRAGYTIKYIKKPCEVVQISAVRNQSASIEYIHRPTEKVKRIAFEKNKFAFRYIKNPSRDLCRDAVHAWPPAIAYVPKHKQTQEMALTAITYDPLLKSHIKIPLTDKLISEIVLKSL